MLNKTFMSIALQRKCLVFLVWTFLFPLLSMYVASTASADPEGDKHYIALKRLHTAKKYDAALEFCRKYLEIHGNAIPEGKLAILFGTVLLKSDKPEELILARNAFRWGYLTDPEFEEEGLFHVAEAFRRLEMWDESILTYRRFLEQFPRSVYADEGKLRMGDSMVRAGYSGKAVSLFEEIKTNPALAVKAKLGLLKAYALSGEPAKAAIYLDEFTGTDAMIIQGEDGSVLAAAIAEAARDRVEQARYYIGVMEEKYAASPLIYRMYLVKGDVLLKEKLKQDRKGEAIAAYEHASISNEIAPISRFRLMEIYMGDGDYRKAESLGRELLIDYPYLANRRKIAAMTAHAIEAQGDLKGSLLFYKEAESATDVQRVLTSLHGSNPAAFNEVYPQYLSMVTGSMAFGEMLLADGRLEDAGTVFKKHVLGPEQNEAVLNLAKVYASMGYESLALDFLDDMIARHSKDSDVFRLYAELSHRLGRMEKAMTMYEKISDKTGEEWITLGSMYEKMEKNEKAIACYTKAIAEGNSEGHMRRADLRMRMGAGKKALPDYAEAMSASESDSDKAWAAWQAGRITGKVEYYKSAAEANAGVISKAAKIALYDKEFKEKHGGDRSLK
ncbi:MAG: tetratricopeptide repeat protein [Nitrospirae bacterium]|nr:tetratricopeptide repeat protein [Nitrospirota bacterium]